MKRTLAYPLAIVILLAAALTAPAAAAEPAPPDDGAKIAPELREKLAVTGTTPFWIRFADRADTAPRPGESWTDRGTRVAGALRATAAASQAGVRDWLDAAGVPYRAFWATNAIYVESGTPGLAEQVAARADVQSLYPTRRYEVPDPAPGTDSTEAEPVEWGIAQIRADAVWRQYADRGDGIVVANIDTGVQYDHPALVGQYRGNRGDGTFDHDYNWFDAAGTCPSAAPCDGNGHGTHTMGTMAGGEGIGVAPGVRWIAANGCCPDDAALIASGQWMLEPTDLAGEHPDASKRPHVINNSWGSGVPSTDPFMEDVIAAWAASGIFGVWSNGNEGPACKTAGSPGSRALNYSVGAYDPAGLIADFSSRGAGQDGQIKPNISAPGVDVRSALPGNRYGSASGTSMAAPHVAGAVALLWSAAPTVLGDVAATHRLLDGSAVDAPDGQCGGTAQDNNVYGEGRLDALALLDAAPVEATGTLTATVTDARTGDPVAGARVSIGTLGDRERVTGADGRFTLRLPEGEHTVTVAAFGYHAESATVAVAVGGTTTRDFALRTVPHVTLRGQVTDGSGHGWPLAATVTVDGVPGGTVHTGPADGGYAVSVPAGAAYTLRVEPNYPGYPPVTRTVTAGARDVRLDVPVPADLAACVTAGYRYAYTGTGSSFDSGRPDGWTVTDARGAGQVWRFDDPYPRGNLTGGRGGFAIMDSRFYGAGGTQDTALVTPVADLTGVAAPVLGFKEDYQALARDRTYIDLSLDGGATWQTLLERNRSARGPREQAIPIPQAAGQPRVQVRFRYTGTNDYWWQLDDVYVGARSCEPAPGGLVVGHVRDRNTGTPVGGATVAGVTSAPDGSYWLFAPGSGAQRFTATADWYRPHTQKIAVRPSKVTERDFRLPAGRLAVRPATISAAGTATRTFTVRNTGTAPATVTFTERSVIGPPAVTDGAGAPVTRVPGDFSPLAVGRATGRGPGPVTGPAPWQTLPDLPARVMDNTVAERGGTIYSIGGVDETGPLATGWAYRAGAWTRIAGMPEGREAPAGAFIGDTLYVNGGWGPNGRATGGTYAYDPVGDSWRTVAPSPVWVAAAGRAVLGGKLYLVGGCTNACGMTDVQRYDPASDTWERVADYPEYTGHVACGAVDGLLYCAGGTARGTVSKNTYAYDPVANTWTPRADLPIDLWGMGYTASSGQLLVAGGITGGAITNEAFAYDPAADTWRRLPASASLTYRGGSGCGLYRIGGSVRSGLNPSVTAELLPTYGDCAPVDVPWLSVGVRTATIAPGRTLTVTVRLDAAAAGPGTHAGGVWIREDTPYLVAPVDVRLTLP